MAVFTEVSAPNLAQWLKEHAGLGLQAGPEPVSEGIENTNYTFVADNGGKYMFTVLEVWDMPRAEYCASLAAHLHRAGQPVPAPAPLAGGRLCHQFAGKPALVVEFVAGTPKCAPQTADCRQIAATLASLHRAAGDFAGDLANARGWQWRQQAAERIADRLDADERRLLTAAEQADRSCAESDLPAAACHCDLFRNNVLWQEDRISAIIDFYFAGCDHLLFDLAVTAVDWCFDDQGMLDREKLAEFAAGYASVRPPTEAEKRKAADMFAVAALRFWLSRLDDRINPRAASIIVEHDPDAFRRRLASCLDNCETIRQAFA
ncbi:MAG: homoserine kinase [Betaproteobacteria bacterium]|nr:homoserine kinase [Betaproteobacteria bacterium]